MSGDCHKGWYHTVFQIRHGRSGSGTDIAAKDVWIPIKARVGALSNPGTDLDLDDVAATSPKAKAELEALRNRITLLEQKLVDYRTEIAKVNNEFGCQTADWPDAWRRVAAVKQDVGRFFREGEALRAENARLRTDAKRYVWLRDLLSVEDVERLVNEHAQWSWCETDQRESAKTDVAVDKAMEGWPCTTKRN